MGDPSWRKPAAATAPGCCGRRWRGEWAACRSHSQPAPLRTSSRADDVKRLSAAAHRRRPDCHARVRRREKRHERARRLRSASDRVARATRGQRELSSPAGASIAARGAGSWSCAKQLVAVRLGGSRPRAPSPLPTSPRRGRAAPRGTPDSRSHGTIRSVPGTGAQGSMLGELRAASVLSMFGAVRLGSGIPAADVKSDLLQGGSEASAPTPHSNAFRTRLRQQLPRVAPASSPGTASGGGPAGSASAANLKASARPVRWA